MTLLSVLILCFNALPEHTRNQCLQQDFFPVTEDAYTMETSNLIMSSVSVKEHDLVLRNTI